MKLRDPFDNVLRRENKFDYVPWSSIADRLDEAAPGWSFAILAIGPDWVHGRLTLGTQTFENIGYAENAEADWAKEVLKHAATDSFKRCAALAGVARYLYDKDAGAGGVARPAPRPTPVQAAPQRPVAVPADLPWTEDELLPYDGPTPVFEPIGKGGSFMPGDECPEHPGEKWKGTVGDLFHKKPEGGYCRPVGQKPTRQKASAR